jgi:hypothetical protein
MHRKLLAIYLTLLLLSVTVSNAAQQTLLPELEKVSRAVETFVRKNKPDWHHKPSLPPTPAGSQPSATVAIHFWSSERCVTAELLIDGVNVGKHPVSCRIKLAIDQSESAFAARERLAKLVREEPSASPIPVGEKGYTWRGGHIVFVKGKFTFWLDGGLDLRVGDFTNNSEFMEKLAKEIANAAPDI